MRENAPQYFERMNTSTAILYAGIFSGINLAVLFLGGIIRYYIYWQM